MITDIRPRRSEELDQIQQSAEVHAAFAEPPDDPRDDRQPGQPATALNGAKLLPNVIAGIGFIDGEKPEKTAA